MKKLSIKILCAAVCAFTLFSIVGAPAFSTKALADSNPISVIKVMDSNRAEVFATKLSPQTDETYNPQDRKWNGIPHIEITEGGRLWATWYSGGANEPDVENYIIVAYSDDNGLSWVDPFILIDSVDTTIRVLDPFMYTRKTGELIVYYHFGGARWELTIKNPDAAPIDIEWEQPKVTNVDLESCIQEPVRLKNGDLCIVSQPAYLSRTLDFMVSLDDGLTWSKRATVQSTAEIKTISEAKTVQLNDGTLWLLARIDCGRGVERFVSTDNGYTWSAPEYDLPYPLIGPGSRFNVTKLKSGNLLFVTNDSTSARTSLTAFLSTDDGRTWPYSLLLDGRANVTYPEICESNDGYIYCVWDKGRNVEKEVRLSVFNEQDIKDGAIHSAKGQHKTVVVKDNNYVEIVATNTTLKSYREVNLGTSKADMLADLPTTLSVTFDNGDTMELTGEWKCIGYQPKKEGTYTATFDFNEKLPSKTTDAKDILSVKVRVVKQQEQSSSQTQPSGGCNGVVIGSIIGGVIIVCAAAVVILILNKRKNSKV
ncbi:MAG: exo-alpha-sialidase [Clostridia bacterium]|nr:exo-alpha-sialidase [Clostridia bacterium]